MAIASVKYAREGEEEVRKQKYTSLQLELLIGRSHTIPLNHISTRYAHPTMPSTQNLKLRQKHERVSLYQHPTNRLYSAHNTLK